MTPTNQNSKSETTRETMTRVPSLFFKQDLRTRTSFFLLSHNKCNIIADKYRFPAGTS